MKTHKFLGKAIFLMGLFIVTPLFAQEAQKAAPATEIVRPTVVFDAETIADPFNAEEPPKKKEKAMVIEKISTEAITPEDLYGGSLEERPLPALTVQGLVWGDAAKQAIINNKVVTIGDVVNGVVIKDIGKEGVTVLFEYKEFSLPTPSAQAATLQKAKGG